jgi:hypothetical protein
MKRKKFLVSGAAVVEGQGEGAEGSGAVKGGGGSGVFIYVYEAHDKIELVAVEPGKPPARLKSESLNGLIGASCRMAIRRMRKYAETLGLEVEAVLRDGQINHNQE